MAGYIGNLLTVPNPEGFNNSSGDTPSAVSYSDYLRNFFSYENQSAIAQWEREQSSADKAMKFEAEQAKNAMEFEAEQADKAMSFEDSQALRQMQFQERMSSTAYQRAVEDLQKAGINPLLAVGAQASSPAGSAASGFSSAGKMASGKTASSSKASYGAVVGAVSQMYTAFLTSASKLLSSLVPW